MAHFLFGILVDLSSVIEGPVQITEHHINILRNYEPIIVPTYSTFNVVLPFKALVQMCR